MPSMPTIFFWGGGGGWWGDIVQIAIPTTQPHASGVVTCIKYMVSFFLQYMQLEGDNGKN